MALKLMALNSMAQLSHTLPTLPHSLSNKSLRRKAANGSPLVPRGCTTPGTPTLLHTSSHTLGRKTVFCCCQGHGPQLQHSMGLPTPYHTVQVPTLEHTTSQAKHLHRTELPTATPRNCPHFPTPQDKPSSCTTRNYSRSITLFGPPWPAKRVIRALCLLQYALQLAETHTQKHMLRTLAAQKSELYTRVVANVLLSSLLQPQP